MVLGNSTLLSGGSEASPLANPHKTAWFGNSTLLSGDSEASPLANPRKTAWF
jgi:hypothetical protein